jgi:hypothetical protein
VQAINQKIENQVQAAQTTMIYTDFLFKSVRGKGVRSKGNLSTVPKFSITGSGTG